METLNTADSIDLNPENRRGLRSSCNPSSIGEEKTSWSGLATIQGPSRPVFGTRMNSSETGESNKMPIPIHRNISGLFPLPRWALPCTLFLILLAMMTPSLSLAQSPEDPPPPLPIGPAPVIHLEEMEHDWGLLLQGSLARHRFKIENHGKAPLRILKVSSTCGCTSTHHDEMIEVGGSGVIELQVDTSNFGAGRHRKNAVVRTNDPENSEVELWMSGQVDPLFQLQSRVFKLEGLAFESKKFTTTILPATDAPFQITAARSKNGSFTVAELVPLEKGWRLTLECGTSSTIGSLRDDVEFDVTLPDREGAKVPVPVVVQHLDRLRIIPNGNIVFYRRHTAPLDGPVKRAVTKEVQVRSVRDDLPIEILSAEIVDAPEGLFAVNVTEILPGHHYKIRIEGLRTHPTSQARGLLRLRLSEGENQIREKPVIAQFRLRQPDSP